MKFYYILQGKQVFFTSSLLCCTPRPFWKGSLKKILSFRKYFPPARSKFFPFRLDSFSEMKTEQFNNSILDNIPASKTLWRNFPPRKTKRILTLTKWTSAYGMSCLMDVKHSLTHFLTHSLTKTLTYSCTQITVTTWHRPMIEKRKAINEKRKTKSEKQKESRLWRNECLHMAWAVWLT